MHLGTFRERVEETAERSGRTSTLAEDDLQNDIEFSPEEFTEREDATGFKPEGFVDSTSGTGTPVDKEEERVEGFRAPGDPASTAELLKFLFDRTGYIKQLEADGVLQ